MTKKSLKFLLLAFLGLQFSSAALAAPYKNKTNSDNVQANKVILKQHISIDGCISPPRLVKPLLKKPYQHHQYAWDSDIYAKKNLITTYVYPIDKKANEKSSEPAISIVKQPAYGTLEISGIKRLKESRYDLEKKGWKEVDQSSSTGQSSDNKSSDNKVKPKNYFERGVTQIYYVFYTPTSKFKDADEFVLQKRTASGTNSLQTQYNVTCRHSVPHPMIIPK